MPPKPAKKDQSLFIAVPIVLMVLGLGCAVISSVSHIKDAIMVAITPVNHPNKPNFDAYNKLLSEIVVETKDGNRVDYNKAKSNPNLEPALKEVAENAPDKFMDDRDKISYWVNAHNLLVIKAIADHYPIESALKVAGDLARGRRVVGGTAMSADDILYTKIQPFLNDQLGTEARNLKIMFLVCRGAVGEPDLLNHAITKETLLKDAKANAWRFTHHKFNVYINEKRNKFLLSPWFQWHSSVTMNRYHDNFELVKTLLTDEEAETNSLYTVQSYLKDFDWSVNDLKK